MYDIFFTYPNTAQCFTAAIFSQLTEIIAETTISVKK